VRFSSAQQDSIGAVLGICFRLLGTSRNSDSVVSTAAATVRQVMQAAAELWLDAGNGTLVTRLTEPSSA
jgi:hypothetical protein